MSAGDDFLQRFPVDTSIFRGKSGKGVVEKQMFCRYTPQLSRSDVLLDGRGTGTIFNTLSSKQGFVSRRF